MYVYIKILFFLREPYKNKRKPNLTTFINLLVEDIRFFNGKSS